MAGILGQLFGLDVQGDGILGKLGRGLAENSNTLLGYGLGGSDGLQAGMQQDQLARRIAQAEAEKERQKVLVSQAAQKLGIDPILAQANPDILGTVAARKYAPKELSFEQQQFQQLSPEQQAQYRQQHFLGAADTWKPIVVEDGAGGKRTMFQRGGQFATPEQLGVPAGAAAAGNIYSPPGGGTVEQNNAALFANRAAQAHDILNEKEGALLSKTDAAAGNVPIFGNSLVSEDKQLADQAKVNFVTAVLRKESGASISPSEFEQAEKVYFPQVGDSEKTIEQKRQARITAVKGLMGSAGRGYNIPENWRDPNTAGVKKNPPKGSSTPGAIPPAAVEYLKKNPGLRPAFDAKYGPGSSAQVLGIPDA